MCSLPRFPFGSASRSNAKSGVDDSVVVPPHVGMRAETALLEHQLQNARHTCVATASMEADLTRPAAQSCEASGNVHSIA